MPLPENFNEWEHLQHTIRRAHNSAVRDFFRSQPDNNIGTTKGSAKHACLMKDADTTAMTSLRMWLFWVVCRKMRDNFEPHLGIRIPPEEFEVKYKPQVTCFFLEDPEDVKPGYRPVEGQLSVRLIEETSKTLTKANLQTIAKRIETQFGQNNGFVWNKGKKLYTYVDKPLGHRHKVLAKNKTNAEQIFKKLLNITQDTYKGSLLRLNAAEDEGAAFPNTPGTQTILGETYKESRTRPLANVRFMYAQIKIHGLPKPIILVDKSGYHLDAIIPAW